MTNGTASMRKPETQPESHYFEDLGLHFGIRCVEVRLEFIEAVKIPGFRNLIAAPRGLLHPWKDYSCVCLRGFALRPDIPIAAGRCRITSGLLEPWVLVRGMVDDEVDQNPDATLFAAMRELNEVAQCAIARIDTVVVGNIVTAVAQ